MELTIGVWPLPFLAGIEVAYLVGPGETAEWRNSGIAEWQNSEIAEWRNRCVPPTRNRK